MTEPRWFAHVNVNCSDLERSTRYYQDVLGLSPRWYTAPPPQDGAGFGLPGQPVRWEGQLLTDWRGLRGPVLDLLDWKQPAPAPAASIEPSTPGLHSIVIAAADLDEIASSSGTVGAPFAVGDGWTGEATTGVMTSDPDGITIQAVQSEKSTLLGVRLNTTDLEGSRRFFAEVLGLDSREATMREGDRRCLVHFPGNRNTFQIELLEPVGASTIGVPREPNQIGIFRIALLAEDLAAAYDELRSHGVEVLAPPVDVALGEGIPTVRALFFRGPEGCVLEYIEGGLA